LTPPLLIDSFFSDWLLLLILTPPPQIDSSSSDWLLLFRLTPLIHSSSWLIYLHHVWQTPPPLLSSPPTLLDFSSSEIFTAAWYARLQDRSMCKVNVNICWNLQFQIEQQKFWMQQVLWIMW
jgi:hypothetical protein